MDSKNKYNDEPVYFCTRCLSLKIMRVPGLYESYCDDCGCADTMTVGIEIWEKLYKSKYNVKFLNKKY